MSGPNIAGEVDAHSRTWHIIDRYFADRLRHLRGQLETNLSEADTIGTRNRIREINTFLAATRPQGVPPAGSPSPDDRGPLAY